MMKLVSYSCAKCGSVLNVEKGQEVLDCPFCGTAFNLVSFHRSEMLQQMRNNLKRKEFSAAKDKCRTILKDDPADFDALIGLVYAGGKISSSEELRDIRTASKYQAKSALAIIEAEQGCATSENGLFFYKLSELLKKVVRYQEIEADISKIRKDNKMEYERISEISENEANVRSDFFEAGMIFGSIFSPSSYGKNKRSGDSGNLVIEGVIGFFVLWFIILAVTIMKLGVVKGTLISLGVLIGAAALVFLASYLIARKYKKQEEAIREVTAENHSDFLVLKKEMEELEKSYEEAWRKLPEYRREDADGKSSEKPEERPAAKSEVRPAKKDAEDIFEVSKKTITCGKCAATLELDQKRNLFACKFCGVAYGASLFIGSPSKKAASALLHKEFEEADLRFSHMLMIAPSDYEALLGRILSTGMWMSLKDVKLTETTHIPPFRLKKLHERIGEAKEHAEDADKELFELMDQLVEIFPQAEEFGKNKTRAKYYEEHWIEESHKFHKIHQKILRLDQERSQV